MSEILTNELKAELQSYLEYKKENENVKVAVGMSGGVDSSTVAYILKSQGYDIVGVTMQTCGDNMQGADIKDAKKVCDTLGIEHRVINLQGQFKVDVMDYFTKEYLEGKTPNPCMVCNRHIKLGRFLDEIKNLGYDYFATGHYALLKDGMLYMGDDPKKDQVYFLSQIKKEYLKMLMFPIGNLEKTQVREIAKALGIHVHAKKDSQEICFVDDDKLEEFLIDSSEGKALNEGEIVTTKGEVLGRHRGLSFYTIGQRKGLGISYPTPLYVLKLDSKKNRLIVGSDDKLFKENLVARDINLLAYDKLEDLDGVTCYAKTRSRDSLHKCRVEVITDSLIKVNFLEEMVRAITPGQGVVLYDDKHMVIASGFIK